MKVWCETCKGVGFEIEMIYSGEDMWEGRIECDDCNGKGYTVNETIEHEARVGRAFMEAIEHYNLACGYKESESEICSVKELFESGYGQ